MLCITKPNCNSGVIKHQTQSAWKTGAAWRFFSGSVSSTCLPETRNTCIHTLSANLHDKRSAVFVLAAHRDRKWCIKPLFVPIRHRGITQTKKNVTAACWSGMVNACSWELIQEKHWVILHLGIWIQAKLTCTWLGLSCHLASVH